MICWKSSFLILYSTFCGLIKSFQLFIIVQNDKFRVSYFVSFFFLHQHPSLFPSLLTPPVPHFYTLPLPPPSSSPHHPSFLLPICPSRSSSCFLFILFFLFPPPLTFSSYYTSFDSFYSPSFPSPFSFPSSFCFCFSSSPVHLLFPISFPLHHTGHPLYTHPT